MTWFSTNRLQVQILEFEQLYSITRPHINNVVQIRVPKLILCKCVTLRYKINIMDKTQLLSSMV